MHNCRILFLFLTLFAFSSLNGQEDFYVGPTPTMHEPLDWTLSLSPNYVYHPQAPPRIVGGLNTMVFMGKYVSLNGSIGAGQGYFHFGTGIIALPLIIMGGIGFLTEGTGAEGFLIGLALIVMAFENMNFHIPVTSHLEISPYFSLVRIKYFKEGYGANQSQWNANIVGGIRLNIFISERFFIAPYTEATRDWLHGNNTGLWGVNGGLYAGFYFGRNE